ncbi:MAG: UbiX family flavin prenyltransferase [Chitinophagia bacterium]|nr:UbiX family flavin prenyltransferase [Chitinophagia bacterium]
MAKKILIGITGASGFIYALRCITHLKAANVEVHVVMTKAAQITRSQEVKLSLTELKKSVDYFYPIEDIGASIASGSFQHDGMVILPCSMNTLAEMACGITNNLLTRAADVCLKERRTLIIMPRETPLHAIHLKNMTTLSELGAIIYPPMPAFYQHPQSLEEMVDHTLGRILTLLGISQGLTPPWQGWR